MWRRTTIFSSFSANFPPHYHTILAINCVHRITAYLLVALFFVTGWESARPVSWRLPLLFLLSWYGRLRRMLPAVNGDGRRAAAVHPFLNDNGYFWPGPTGLQAPALLTGVRPLLE